MLSSIIGACAVRISRLTTDGTPDFNNANGSLVLAGGISSFEHDFEIETGDDLLEKDACGVPVVVRKYPDIVKRVTFTLTVSKKSYELDEILNTGVAVTEGGNIVGMAVEQAAGCEPGSQGNGVAIELWAEQFDCADFADSPYQKVIIPRAFLTPSGFSRESGIALPVYSGFGTANNNYGDGPFGEDDPLVGIDNWAYAEMDADDVPTMPDPFDYVAMPASAS